MYICFSHGHNPYRHRFVRLGKNGWPPRLGKYLWNPLRAYALEDNTIALVVMMSYIKWIFSAPSKGNWGNFSYDNSYRKTGRGWKMLTNIITFSGQKNQHFCYHMRGEGSENYDRNYHMSISQQLTENVYFLDTCSTLLYIWIPSTSSPELYSWGGISLLYRGL